MENVTKSLTKLEVISKRSYEKMFSYILLL